MCVNIYIYTHTHTRIRINIYTYMCTCINICFFIAYSITGSNTTCLIIMCTNTLLRISYLNY